MSTPLEIERKFLVNSMDDIRAEYDLVVPTVFIQQCYLVNTPDIAIRVRMQDYFGPQGGVKCILCVKEAIGEDMLVRAERQFPLDLEMTMTILDPLREEHVIRKNRYCVDDYDIDEFGGPLQGLVVVEREFSSVEEANAFVVPSWLGREVTSDPAYINSNLIGKKYDDGRLVEFNSLS